MRGNQMLRLSLALVFCCALLSACTGQDKVAEGKKLLEEEKFDLAETAFEAALQSDSEDPEAHWGRASARMKLVRYDEAIVDLTQAISLASAQKVPDAQFGKYHLDRGLSHYALANFKEALPDFQKAIDLNYKLAEAYSYLGVCLGNMQKPVESVSALNESIKLNPEDHFARANRGYYNSLLGDNRTAIEDFNTAIRLKPEDKTSYLNRGYTYIGMNDYVKAKADFQKALEIDPEFIGAIVYMGITLTNTNQPQEALEWLNRAIDRQPENPTLFYYRGVALINLGRTEEGCTDLQHSVANGDPQGAAMMQEYCGE
jgi:tetratricopeptide (TPR) repeat protein